ncbi:sensory box histidine kinase/response regulator [Labilithrix luteola]|uniref:histidine kinase n=1 Tax=Labilithrix luteola TaxID=1391654 RepID=A0A0K1PJP4_9BACT|nr:ATP-binding protein [Labilithrix luteola]AKU93758.1 sensory box histidine kinase/response regulator [Labilithrix luteola]
MLLYDDDKKEPRATYARALEHMTEVLLTETDTTRVLEGLARIAGETLNADRALIYDIRTDDQLAVALCEWLNPREAVSPTIATYPLSIFADAEAEVYRTRRPLESHAERPHVALSKDGSGVLLHENMSIQSLLWYPFDFRRTGYYLLVFNQVTHARPWLPREIEFLRIATRHAELALMQIAMKVAQVDSERAILEAQKAESIALLAGGVAHDFNNLLGIVIGAVARARSTLGAEAPLDANLRDAERAAREASDLAKHLLAYAGKAQFVAQNVDLVALASEMQDLLRAAAGSAQVTFSSSGPCFVHGDAGQLRQILMNFVVNAKEAVADSGVGRISVSVRREGPKVLLEVRDNGRGMSQDVQKKIFEPFYSTKTLGRGLGLAAVSGIVRSHGADLQVQSEPNEGTTFTVAFPAVGVPVPPRAFPWHRRARASSRIPVLGRTRRSCSSTTATTCEGCARACSTISGTRCSMLRTETSPSTR